MNFMICAALLSAQTEVGEWYATGGIYREEIEVEVPALEFDDFTTVPITAEFDTDTEFRAGVGVRITEQFNLELELGSGSSRLLQQTDSYSLFAQYEYTTIGALIAYPISVNESLTFVPKLGLGFTDVDASASFQADDPLDPFGEQLVGVAFKSGDELTLKMDLSVQYSISDMANLVVGYRQETTDTDLGDATSSGLMFAAQINF